VLNHHVVALNNIRTQFNPKSGRIQNGMFGAWLRPVAWFVSGAGAGLLLLHAPLALAVATPLAVPVAGIVSARRAWSWIAHPSPAH
jgi:hypothetical protein